MHLPPPSLFAHAIRKNACVCGYWPQCTESGSRNSVPAQIKSKSRVWRTVS